MQEAGDRRAGLEGDKLEELVDLVEILLPGDDVARRGACRRGGSGVGGGGGGVAGCDGRIARDGALLYSLSLLLGGVVGGRRRRRSGGLGASGRGGSQVQDGEEADWGVVEWDKPDGEDLEDGDVEEIGTLIVDCFGG